jgi:peptidoglycan/LPS O-acetylase OafA/YrhL
VSVVEIKEMKPPAKAKHDTAYLDGLRGFAALLVYSLHHQVWGHSGVQGELILENVFGWEGQYYFVCLPGIRLLFSGGHFAVAIFFVISGYVLSLGPLRALHAQDQSGLARRLGSALFRRWVRLFLPVLATTFVWMTTWHMFGIKNNNPIADAPQSNYLDELWKWYCDFKNFSFVFTGEPANAYNDHTWSIPMEFRGSIVVYTACLAFTELSTNSRLLCEAGLVWYFLYIVDGWFCCLFMVGMLFCDLSLLAKGGQLPRLLERLRPTRRWPFYIMFAAAIYLAGVPSISNDLPHLRRSPGWWLLSFLKPQAVYDFRWFYRVIAATLAMVSIPNLPWIKAFFETRFCQYLGKISFGLYLVHGPVLWSLGDRIYAAVGCVREGHTSATPGWINLAPFSDWGPFGLEINYLAAQLILLPFTIWLADLVTRAIDEPSVKFSQYLLKRASSSASALPVVEPAREKKRHMRSCTE